MSRTCLAAHERALAPREKHVACRNLTGLSEPLHRCRVPETLPLLTLLAYSRGDERRPDGTDSYGVNPDPLLHQLVRQRSGKRDDGPLAGSIVYAARGADVSVHRCAVDDGRTAR